MKVEYFAAKSLIRTGRPSLFSWADVGLNPYQGCAHDCRYCDGKSEGYYMHEDFAARLRVKANARELLTQSLRKQGFGRTDLFGSVGRPGIMLGIGGGVCDIYQPAEQEVGATRELLAVAREFRLPVAMITKSAGVLRDLDLLKRINEQSYASCSFTITLADDRVQDIFEPGASSSSERFAAIRALRENGIHAGVYLLPALPFIADTPENMAAVFSRAKDSGAEFVFCGGLTLKPGRNKREFFRTLEGYFPALLTDYQRLYGNDDRYGMPDPVQIRRLGLASPEVQGFRIGCELGMPFAPARYVPEGRIAANLLLSEKLMKVVFLKRTVLGQHWAEARAFRAASERLEEADRDIVARELEQLRAVMPDGPDEFLLELVAKADVTFRRRP